MFLSEIAVSLLVRLWVEIFKAEKKNCDNRSASLWGCELKYALGIINPNREPSASLWGCELKFDNRQNEIGWSKSASLWGCELKYLLQGGAYCLYDRQPPCEAVSWNMEEYEF